MTQGLFVHTKFLGDRALNCKMVKATTRAWQAAMQDPDGAVEALHKLFPNTNKGAKDLTKKQWIDSADLLYYEGLAGQDAGPDDEEDWDAC